MSAFTRHDFELAYLAAFAALGVQNTAEAKRLAEITHDPATLVACCQEMARAKPWPGRVHKAYDFLRPLHERWEREHKRVAT